MFSIVQCLDSLHGPAGQVATLDFDAPGRLESISHTHFPTVAITCDAGGRIDTLDDADDIIIIIIGRIPA